MKALKLIALALALLVLTPVNANAAGGFGKEKFTKIVYFQGASGTGSGTGSSYDNGMAIADGDIWAIPANAVIEKVYVVVDTAITGTTNLDIGDDDDADGYVDGSLSVTLGTAGMYGYNAKVGGAYLRVETAGATDALDLYVVPTAKAYLATGKEIKLDVTTANTAGKFRVVIEGFLLGA